MLDDEMLGQLFLELPLLCSRARHHKIVAVSAHRHMNLRSNGTDKAKTCPVSYPTAGHGSLTRNIEALCSILRSIHGSVQNCVTARTLVIFSWHLDHDGTTCRAVEMNSTDVVEIPKLSLQQVLSACQSHID